MQLEDATLLEHRRELSRIRNRRWRMNNPESAKRAANKYREANPEEFKRKARERARLRYRLYPEKMKEARRRWKLNHPEPRKDNRDKTKRRVRQAVYRSKNKAKIALQPSSSKAYKLAWYHNNIPVAREYYQQNKSKIAESRKAYAAQNRDKIKAYQKEYIKKHWSMHLYRSSLRRALKKQATINLVSIKTWILAVRERKHFQCYYCYGSFPIGRLHFDHIIPLVKGGAHSVENLCTSCDTCNLTKKDKSIGAWVRIGQQVLSL